MKFKFISSLIILLFLSACTRASIEYVTPVADVAESLKGRGVVTLPYQTQSGQGELSAYVAKTDEERAQGLMFIKSLPKNHGMIFLDDKMAQPNFWMKNMEMSLDFVYLDDKGIVVDVLENIPPCTAKKDEDCERYHPQVPAQYVVEVPEGWVKEVGLKVGDAFELKSLENKNI